MTVVRSSFLLPAEPLGDLGAAADAGWLDGLAAARAATPTEIMDEVADAGVRGRGGAGFPTASKWRGVAAGAGEADRVTVVVNAAEGEPGTFKDRALLRANPYAVVTGALIAATALDADRLVVATKASYRREIEALDRTIAELVDAGWADGIEIAVVEGPDHYLFGEETALLEVIEGEDPLPRHIPPYLYGLFSNAPQLGWSAGAVGDDATERLGSNPVVVNNVETYAHVSLVMRRGAAWYRGMGTRGSPGPTIVTVTGDVMRPAVAEVELGHPLRAVIDEVGGGVAPDRSVKAVLSGVSNGVLTSEALGASVSYEGLSAAGGGLGSAGFIVYDDSRNMVDVAHRVARFLHVESCGQCTPCKTGSGAVNTAFEQLVLDGALGSRASNELERALQTITDGSRCFLPQQVRTVIPSLLAAFPDDLEERLAGRTGDVDVPFPKLVDLADGVATVDESIDRKLPDWTYSEVPVRLGRRAEPTA